jgi:hypothetical protein
MVSSDEDRGRNRRPGAEDQGWSHRSGTQWPDVAVCDMHRAREDDERGFLS